MRRAFNPARHCGAKSRRCTIDPPTCHHIDGVHACLLGKGAWTDHPGAGRCKYHGGSSPNGLKYAQTEAATRELARLGIPIGNGDPIDLLNEAVRHARGLLEASGLIVVRAAEPDSKRDLASVVDLYVRAIAGAHRTAKASVDANIAERMAAINERQADVILRALQAALDVAGVHGDVRAAAEAALVQALRVKAPVGVELN